jgi:hypothetical protein
MVPVRDLLDYDFVIQALMNKMPYSQIASRESERLSVPVSRNVIAGVSRDLKQGNLRPSLAATARKAQIPSLLNRPTFVHGQEHPIPGGIPIFTGHLELDYNAVLVMNDLHGTKVDIEFLQRTADVIKYFGIRHVIIAGDLADNDAINPHKRRSVRYETNLKLEIDILTEILEWVAERVDDVVLYPGNHDLWLIEQVDGSLNYTDTVRLLVRSHEVRRKLLISDYDRLTLKSGERVWTISHQSMYSPTPLVTAQKLSEKYETDIYTTHQHISAGPVLSKNGKHVLMDVGGMFDPDKFAYVNMKTTASRVMNQGFATIMNGKGKLWTPNPLITDWNIYNDTTSYT